MSVLEQLAGVYPDARILIVDDEPTNVLLLERILRGAHYTQLESTTDPRETEAILTRFHPDLILLDLLMPHMDGYTLMEMIRSRVPDKADLPILILTADMTPEAKQGSLSRGASDFLTKPLDRIEVLLRIHNLLENHFLHLGVLEQKEHLEATVAERTGELRDTIGALERIDARRRELLARLVRAQEDERRRLATEVHDGPIQAMTALGLRLFSLRSHANGADSETVLDELNEIVGLSVRKLRRLVVELRPPTLDRGGLAIALREYLEDLREESGMDFQLHSSLSMEPPIETRAAVYRIAQEAITNMRRIADVRSVRLQLEWRDGGVLCRIEGDGVGPSSSREDGPHDGDLYGLRERTELVGGTLIADAATGPGTVTEFWVP